MDLERSISAGSLANVFPLPHRFVKEDFIEKGGIEAVYVSGELQK